MAHNKYFQFKQFRIEQHHAPMKVNTDGVLLGAWAQTKNAATVLDVGTGTGIIALMIAQRCNAQITGIEIDEQAAIEAAENVAKSPWPERITILPVSLQQFAAAFQGKFDLIISNPPFFSNSVKSTNPRLSAARHNHSLPFHHIISAAQKLLSAKGRLSLILPTDEAKIFSELAEDAGLYLNRIALVKPFPDKEPNRVLLEFGLISEETSESSFSIYDETGKNYSADFVSLARGFYLKL